MLHVFDEACMKQLSFITEVALGFVAFSIGSELKMSSLRSLGKGIIYIILAESFAAFLLVAAAIYAITGDAALSLVFGSMAPASAPAGTVAVIQEFKAKGSLTKALYAVVGFDDALAIIIFGFAAALAKNILIAEATGHNGHKMSADTHRRLELLDLFDQPIGVDSLEPLPEIDIPPGHIRFVKGPAPKRGRLLHRLYEEV